MICRRKLAIAATRRAKIICTIGPSCNTEARAARNDASGHGRGPAELFPRHASRACAQYRPPAPRGQTGRPHHLHPAGLARPQDPHRAAQGQRAGAAQDRIAGHHHASRYPRHAHSDLDYISGTGAGSAAGLAHSAFRRSDRTAGDAGAGQRCGMRGGQRRHAGRASGHQPAGSGAVDSRADRQRPRRSGVWAEARRGHGGVVVRALGGGRAHGEGNCPATTAAMCR